MYAYLQTVSIHATLPKMRHISLQLYSISKPMKVMNSGITTKR